MKPAVLHIDSEQSWRGGENQIRLLIRGSEQEFRHFICAEPGSEALSRIGSIATGIPMEMRGVRLIRAARDLVRLVEEQKIDIVDAHSSRAHNVLVLAKYFGLKAKAVVHRRVDNLPGDSFVNKKKYLNSKIDRYVAISAAIGKILENYGVPSDKISVVRSGIDGKEFGSREFAKNKQDLAKAFSLDPETFFVGNASALSDQKGHDTFIRAFKILRDRGENIHGFIAGEGPLRRNLESLRMDLGLDHDVTFLGFIKDTQTFLTSMDCIAVPSNNEGLGTVILESILADRPVIGSNVGGIPEMIRNDETGILIQPGDVQQLADGILKMRDFPAFREKVATAALIHVEQNFSVEQMVSGNIEVYRSLLG